MFSRFYWAVRAVLLRLTRPRLVRQAGALFDAGYYRRQYPDIAAAGIDPLAHFLLAGAREGRNPHPLFDTAYYLRQNPDVAESGINPLLHFLTQGAQQNRKPNPLFDTGYYRAQQGPATVAEIPAAPHCGTSPAIRDGTPDA